MFNKAKLLLTAVAAKFNALLNLPSAQTGSIQIKLGKLFEPTPRRTPKLTSNEKYRRAGVPKWLRQYSKRYGHGMPV